VGPVAVIDAGAAERVAPDTIVHTEPPGGEAGGGERLSSGPDAGVDAIIELPPGDVDGSVERPRRRRPSRLRAPVAVGEGFLVVQARPWARIAVDGLGIGTTPLPALPLPAGHHRVRLEHNGNVKFQTVEVEAQKTTTIQIDMRE
jgi:hypothetical protein